MEPTVEDTAQKLLTESKKIEPLLLYLLKAEYARETSTSVALDSVRFNHLIIARIAEARAESVLAPVTEAAILEIKRVTEMYNEIGMVISARDTEKMERMIRTLELKSSPL